MNKEKETILQSSHQANNLDNLQRHSRLNSENPVSKFALISSPILSIRN